MRPPAASRAPPRCALLRAWPAKLRSRLAAANTTFLVFRAVGRAVRVLAPQKEDTQMTAILRIEHPVVDFDRWREAFDSDPEGRESSGVRRYRVMCPCGDLNL